MTQKDLTFVADFLSEHFSAVSKRTTIVFPPQECVFLTCFIFVSLSGQNKELFDRKGKYFNVERVGQVRMIDDLMFVLYMCY